MKNIKIILDLTTRHAENLFYFLQVTRSSKHVLPHLARLCLVSTFFEDGIRMWVQWSEQREYMDISWGCGWFLATLFVVINLLGQLGGVTMVMLRLKVDIACGILFGIVFLQVYRQSISQTYLKMIRSIIKLQCYIILLNFRQLHTVFCGTCNFYSEIWPLLELSC